MSSLLDESSLGAARSSLGGVPRSVPNLSAFRLLRDTDLAGYVLLGGGAALGDGSGGLFYWNPALGTADNGTTIIRPGSIIPTNPGRWVFLVQQGSGGVTGATNDPGGVGVYNPDTSTASNLHFKSLIAGANITITDNGDGTITILPSTNPVGFVEDLPGYVELPGVKEYPLLGYSWVARVLNAMRINTLGGTCTVTIKINGVAVTGLSNLSITSTPTTYLATALNALAIGGRITIDITAISSANDLELTIKATRTA